MNPTTKSTKHIITNTHKTHPCDNPWPEEFIEAKAGKAHDTGGQDRCPCPFVQSSDTSRKETTKQHLQALNCFNFEGWKMEEPKNWGANLRFLSLSPTFSHFLLRLCWHCVDSFALQNPLRGWPSSLVKSVAVAMNSSTTPLQNTLSW